MTLTNRVELIRQRGSPAVSISSLQQKWRLAQCANCDPNLSRAAVSVLLRLLDYYNTVDETREHRCYPSISKLAADVNLKVRHTTDLIKELETKGWIFVERRFERNTRRQTSNSYAFNLNRLAAPLHHIACSPPTTVHSGDAPQCTLVPAAQNRAPLHHGAPKQGKTNKGNKNTVDVDAIARAWEAVKTIYPNRPSPNWSAAEAIFQAVIERGVSLDLIVSKVTEYRDSCQRDQTDPKFISQPVTWFKQKCWTVDYAPVSKTNGKPSLLLKPTALLEFVRAFNAGDSWPDSLGPAPNSPGCRVPPEILHQATA
jgi:DNA-binding MarR family transcriptional regulator